MKHIPYIVPLKSISMKTPIIIPIENSIETPRIDPINIHFSHAHLWQPPREETLRSSVFRSSALPEDLGISQAASEKIHGEPL